MKRKQLILTLLALFASINAFATIIDGIYYNFSGGEATVTNNGPSCYSGDVFIPKTISDNNGNEYTVTGIGYKAFCDCRNLTSVTFEEGSQLTTIGESAFQNCTGLTSIDIPDGVTTISKYAFYNCGLTSLFIPKSVTSMVRAFPRCVNLESIVVDDENPTYYSPDNCNAIIRKNDMTLVQGCNNTVIPDGVRYIGPDAFSGCSFTTVSIPESVEYLGNGAYGGATIDNIVIPTSITSIGESCFSGATINHIEIPYSETPITYSCYEESYHARTVFTQATIGTLVIDRKFSLNSSTDYVAPFFLTSIDKLYEGLHGVNWYSSATINDFYLPEGLMDVNQNTSFQKYDGAVYKYGGGKSTINHLHIPEGVLSITKIYSAGTDIYIPSTVTSIADDAFSEYNLPWNNRLCITIYAKGPLAISENTFSSYDIEGATLYVPYGCKAAYEAAGWNGFREIIEINTVNIGSSGFATYCSPNALDFTGITDVRAYVASDFDPATNTLTMTRVMEVPAGEGLYIIGNEGSYEIPETTTDAVYTNLLIGAARATFIEPTESKGSKTNFILADGIHGIGFYSLSEYGWLAGGKAYLQLPTESVSGVKAINLVFDDDATGIASPKFSHEGKDVIYNLAGQQVNKAQKGLYIIKGKKVINK